MKTMILPMLVLAASATIARGIDDGIDARQANTSLRVHQSVAITYPQSMLHRGIVSGEARVAISVAPTGLLADLLVIGYSHREFADAAVAAIRQWDFDPAMMNGDPVATRAILEINFEAHGVVVDLNAASDLSLHLLSFVRERGYGPCPVRELDATPVPLSIVPPLYPQELAEHGVRGSAVVEFFIDETGAVRMAAVMRADFWELGALAVSAVEQWKFAPPTRHGKPVLVRVEQRFDFTGNQT